MCVRVVESWRCLVQSDTSDTHTGRHRARRLTSHDTRALTHDVGILRGLASTESTLCRTTYGMYAYGGYTPYTVHGPVSVLA